MTDYKVTLTYTVTVHNADDKYSALAVAGEDLRSNLESVESDTEWEGVFDKVVFESVKEVKQNAKD